MISKAEQELARGLRLISMGMFEEAVAQLQCVVELAIATDHAVAAKACVELGMLSERKGRHQQARAYYNNAEQFATLAVQPEIVLRALEALSQLDSEQAPETSGKTKGQSHKATPPGTTEQGSCDARHWYSEGHRYHQAGDLDDAHRCWTMATAIGEHHDPAIAASAYRALGNTFATRGQLKEAKENYLNAIRIGRMHNPATVADAHYELGWLFASEGRAVDADREYRSAIEIGDTYNQSASASAHQNLGWLLVAQGRSAEAEQQFFSAIELGCEHNPGAAIDGYCNLGLLCSERGRLEEAESHYHGAIELSGKHSPSKLPKMHDMLGQLLAAQGRAKEAEGSFSSAICLGEDLNKTAAGHSHGHLGLLLAGQGRLKEAEVHYLNAIALVEQRDPRFAAQVHANLGTLYAGQDMAIPAETHFLKAIELGENCDLDSLTGVYVNLGALLRTQGRLSESETCYLNAALAGNGKDPSTLPVAHVNLGSLLAQQGRQEEAEEYYLSAIELGSRYNPIVAAQAHAYIGVLLEGQGRLDDAEKHFLSAVEFGEAQDGGLASRAHANLGSLFADQQRAKEAEDHFLKAIEFGQKYNPSGVSGIYAVLGQLVAEQGRSEEAQSYFLHAIELGQLYDPSSVPNIHAMAGQLLAGQGRLEEAQNHFLCAIEFGQTYNSMDISFLHAALGELLAKQNRLGEAEHHYLLAIALSEQHDPSTAASEHSALAMLLIKQNRLEEAEHHYLHAIELYREHDPHAAAGAHANLASLFAAQDRPREAEKHYLCAILLGEQHNARAAAGAHANLASLFAARNRPREAEKHYLCAIQLGQSHDFGVAAGAHKNLGVLLVNMRQPTAALDHFEVARDWALRAIEASDSPLADIANNPFPARVILLSSQDAAALRRDLLLPYADWVWRPINSLSDILDKTDAGKLQRQVQALPRERQRYGPEALCARGASIVLRERADAWYELFRFGLPDQVATGGAAEALIEDLAHAEQLELLWAEHPSIPPVQSVWQLLEILSNGSVYSTPRDAQLAGQCLEKAKGVCNLFEHDSEGAASAAPLLAATEALIRTIIFCLVRLSISSAVRRSALAMVEPVLRPKDKSTSVTAAMLEDTAQLCVGRAQLCAALLYTGEGTSVLKLGSTSMTRISLLELLCRYADEALEAASKRYWKLKQQTAAPYHEPIGLGVPTAAEERHLDFRADRTALFRTHLEAHLRRAVNGQPERDLERTHTEKHGNREWLVGGRRALELMQAVMDNRRVIDLVEQHPPKGCTEQALSQVAFFEGLGCTNDAWLEVVVGLSMRAEILVMRDATNSVAESAGIRVQARIRELDFTEEGLPQLILLWKQAHSDFHKRAAEGITKMNRQRESEAFASPATNAVVSGAVRRAMPEQSVLLPLSNILDDILDWVAHELEPQQSKCWLRVCPDSVLHDMPWIAAAAQRGIRVSGQALSWATSVAARSAQLLGVHKSILSHSTPPTALIVISKDILESLTWCDAQLQALQRWQRLLPGWKVHLLHTVGTSPDTEKSETSSRLRLPPEWLCPCCADRTPRILHPRLVVWMTHGDISEEYSNFALMQHTPYLLFHDGTKITAQELTTAARDSGLLRMPGMTTELDLSHCAAFLSGACLSGKIDPRFGPEGVGLVRGLFALGVQEVFAPAYRVPLTTGSKLPLLLDTLVGAVAAGQFIGPALWSKLHELHSCAADNVGEPPDDWSWGYATVFSK